MKHDTTLYLDSTFDFGEYSGKTLSSIRQKDPSYVRWCQENIPNLTIRLRMHPTQYEVQDDSWKQIPYLQLMRWGTPGYSMKRQDTSKYIDFN